MATSTFSKQFSVKSEKAAEFVQEMTRTVAPTLTGDFHSNLSHLTQDKDLKENLLKVLNR